MTPQYRASVLILKPTSDPHLTQVLLTDQDTLPQFETAPHLWQTCEPINEGVRITLGLEVVTLRCINVDYDVEKSTVLLTYLLEYQSGEPLSGRWQSTERLSSSLRHLVADTLEPPPHRAAWYRLDWARYVQELFPTARCQQIRSWERSTVWRVRYDDTTLFCKGVGRPFPHEGRLTHWLSKQFPQHLPRLISHQDARWLISQAYVGEMLDTVETIEIWEQALHDYAHLQMQLRSSVTTLVSLGIPQRSMSWLGEIVVRLLEDEAALRSGSDPLTESDIVALRAALPRLQAEMATLDNWVSLEHGDLWAGQIVVEPDQSLIFTDWSDSALTHPFLTLPFFVRELPSPIAETKNGRERLINAYLEPFLHEISLDQATQWLNVAFQLSPLYTAARYYADILPLMEQRWEMENNLAFNLRQVLQAL